MAAIEKTKSEMRVDPKLITAFHELIENGMSSNEAEAMSTPKNNNKRAANGSESEPIKLQKTKASDGDFVIVEKVWSLKPNRLTEHQKEKMKERRCDIPALYNNLSQSQDSVSLKEWTPKVLSTPNTTTTVALTIASVSTVSKSNEKTDGKNQDENVATNNTEHKNSSGGKGDDVPKVASASEPIAPKKLKFDDDTLGEDEEKKKRIERELSRIHIDAKVDAVPFIEGVARRTRSSRSLDERAPKRKLRNDTQSSAVKPILKSIRTTTSNKTKKQTEAPTSKVSDSDSEWIMEEVIQSSQPSQPSQNDQPSGVQKKRKIRTMPIKTEILPSSEDAPIEQSISTIEEHVETVVDVVAISTTKQQDLESPLVMDTNENETELTKEKNDTENMLPPPAVDDDDAFLKVAESNSGIDAEPAQKDAAAVDGDAEDDHTPSSMAAQTVEGNEIAMEKSAMSPLQYNETTIHSNDTPNESILTSPKIDDKKNAEFLNDTLNISPIVSDTENAATNIEADSTMPHCSVVIECTTMVTPKSSGDHVARKTCSIVDQTTTNDPVRNSNESNLPEVALHSKTFRSSQCSTPIQSNQSPISSKFKPQMGRGAQLLKMINSNKNSNQQQQKVCASPTMTMSLGNCEMGTVLVSTTASPTINKLQTAPIYGATVSTPEPTNEPTKSTKSELLTFSRALPSPYESPRFSILKRKASKDAEDDPIHSPAHKRKRVSFNFPLTETVEFITEDDIAPIGVPPIIATINSAIAHREIDALSIRSPGNVKYKMKLKKRIDNLKDMTPVNHVKTVQLNESPIPSTSLAIVANKLFSDTNEEEVSVECIKEYLEMDSTMHREKQKKLSKESVVTTNTDAIASTSNDNEATSLAVDVIAAPSLSPPSPITLSSFNDTEIFQHLFQKFNINEIFNKYEECNPQKIDTQLARFFSCKLSTIMANDGKCASN